MEVLGALSLGFGFALPSIILLLIRRWTLRRRARLEARGRWADGVVVSRPVTTYGDNIRSRIIVVEYCDEHGAARRVKSGGWSRSFPEIGSPARVLFVPGDPSSARIEVDMANQVSILTTLSAIFGGLTVLAFVGIGVALIFFREAFLESIGYEVPDIEAPPGDIAAYRPFSHLDTIAAFAGPDAELISIEAVDVQPDGTLKLGEKGDYGIARVELEFIADPTKRDKRTMDEVTDKVIVRVTVGAPNKVSRFNRGMRRLPAPALRGMARDAKAKVAPRPRCSAAKLMHIARSQGALQIPARILYDTQGYELRTWKKGASLDLRFDHDCELISR